MYPLQLLRKCFPSCMQHLKPWESKRKEYAQLKKAENYIKLGVSLFIKLALFERVFCNGNKIKWLLIIKAVTQWGFVLESSDVDLICISVLYCGLCGTTARHNKSKIFFFCYSNRNKDPDVNMWNNKIAPSVFKFHECQFFSSLVIFWHNSIKKRHIHTKT